MKKMPFQKLAWHTRLSFINALLLQECKSITKRVAVRGDPTRGLLSYGLIRIDIPDRPQPSKDFWFLKIAENTLNFVLARAHQIFPSLTPLTCDNMIVT